MKRDAVREQRAVESENKKNRRQSIAAAKEMSDDTRKEAERARRAGDLSHIHDRKKLTSINKQLKAKTNIIGEMR